MLRGFCSLVTLSILCVLLAISGISCSSRADRTEVVRTETRDPYATGADERVSTTTVNVERDDDDLDDDDDDEGLFGIIGNIIALPFRALAAIF